MVSTTEFQTWQLPARSLPQRLAGALHSAWIAYWEDRAERATVGVLHSLDDRTLKDIGLDRSEIESVAHNLGQERRVNLGARPIDRGRHLSMCA
jgi:uncharacterized protein YjiS (DUF1127 family)